MEKDLITTFNLPSYIKGKSFADASKAIDKKFEGRNDKYSKDTKQELLQRLSEAQEYVKMQEGLSTMSKEVPVMDDIPAEFAEGGSMADYLNLAPQALNAVTNVIGDTAIDDSGKMQYQDVDQVGGAISGALSGAQAGMTLGPLGAVGGGIIGGLSSLIGGKRKQEDIEEANRNFALSQNVQDRSDFSNGGMIKRENKAIGGSLDDIFKVTNPKFTTPAFNPSEPNLPMPGKEQSMFSKQLNTGLDWLGQNFGQIASYAPIAGNLLELKNLSQDVTEPGQRMDNAYNPNYFDQESLINRVNQNNVNRALTESSGGDLGALRNSILAANLNKDKAISDAVIQGDNINRGEDRFKFQSDFNRDRTNVGLDQNYLNRKDADQAAYESTKSNLRRQIFEDVGDIGREEMNKKLVRDIFGYKWNGKYYVDNKGNKYSPSDVAAKLKVAKENEKMYGGYLKKSK